MNKLLFKILCGLLLLNVIQLSAMHTKKEKISDFIKTMRDVSANLPTTNKLIRKLDKNKKNYKNYIKVLSKGILFNDPMPLLKEMIKKDGLIIKDGLKEQKILRNSYCRYLFDLLVKDLSQDQKNKLLDYAIPHANYTMVCWLSKLGAQIDAPWNQDNSSHAMAR